KRAASSELQEDLERPSPVGEILERSLSVGERDAGEPSVRGQRPAGEELEGSGEVEVGPRVRPGDRRLLAEDGEVVDLAPRRTQPDLEDASARADRLKAERPGRLEAGGVDHDVGAPPVPRGRDGCEGAV